MAKKIDVTPEQAEERHKQFLDFCKRHGMTRQRKYRGELIDAAIPEKVGETLCLKPDSVQFYWRNERVIPDYIVEIMGLHDGEIERLCDLENKLK
ncbi:hypothetical protein P5E67_00665 [Vibrio parahaemolyticus]|nr:hypothetical protein [Vibrio parahaemolyticus]